MIAKHDSSVIILYVVVLLGWSFMSVASAAGFEKKFRKQVAEFLDSLDAEEQKECLLPLEHENRWQMLYPGAKRPGILIKKLNGLQKKKMEAALRMVLSDHGWEMANKVAAQDEAQGLDKYYLTCFGDPREDGGFAFRLAEHHLTIVQLEVSKGETMEFGPVLLGSNPADLWQADEEALMHAWKQIKHPGVLIKDKAGVASKPMPENEGVLFSKLDAKAQVALKAAWNQRMSVFQPAIKQRVNGLLKERGGWDKFRVAYYKGAADKRCIDGGRWDFKCGLPGMVWDFEGSRGHIHMSVWVK